jgi:hypothetical protein
LPYLQARKLYESAICPEPEILRAVLASADLRFGETRDKHAICYLKAAASKVISSLVF